MLEAGRSLPCRGFGDGLVGRDGDPRGEAVGAHRTKELAGCDGDSRKAGNSGGVPKESPKVGEARGSITV